MGGVGGNTFLLSTSLQKQDLSKRCAVSNRGKRCAGRNLSKRLAERDPGKQLAVRNEQSPNHRYRNLKAFKEHTQKHVFSLFRYGTLFIEHFGVRGDGGLETVHVLSRSLFSGRLQLWGLQE